MQLRQKLSLFTTGGIVLTSLIAALFAQLLGKGLVERTWQQRFTDFAQVLALPLSRAVATRDLVLLDAYLYDLHARPALDIEAIRIVDPTGNQLMAIGQPAAKAVRLPQTVATIDVAVPLRWNGNALGTLQVAFSKRPVKLALQEMYRLIALMVLVGSLLMVGLSVGIAHRVLRPVTTLARCLERLRRHEPVSLARLTARDEIAQMTNSMLDVYEALQQREAHNREVVQQLEAVTRQLADELAVNAALRERLEAENALLQQRLAQQRPAVTVVGEDGDLAPLMQQVRRAAQSPFAVLLTGESGTGKEVIAQYIHQVSPRHNKPFITVNCAALPEALIESELFGHEKGAFTGATERKLGKFVLADGGTIFLDEIGDLPLAVQPKLLRVLENGCVDRLGAGKPVPVDVRVVAATNRKLEEAVAAGTFRADLYYRLKVLHLHLPPLRQRPRDLAVLAELFLAQTAQEMGIRPPVLSPAALACLRRHPWPGNVRQLRHVLAAALCQHPVAVLEPSHLEPLLAGDEAMSHSTESRLATGPEEWEGDWATLMAMQERRVLEALLAQCRTQKEMAARLKVSEARIHRLLKKHQLLGWKAQQRNGHVPS